MLPHVIATDFVKCNVVNRLMMDNLQLGLSQFNQFLNTMFSQGSVATRLRCGGIFSGQFVSAMVKEN